MKIWILIWRLNPPHIWHMRILKDSFKNNEKTILFLWSANVSDDKNPYSYHQRKGFINKLYCDENLLIKSLDDVSKDEEWVKLINEKLQEFWILKNDEITFYGWDFKNDYAILILKKYEQLLGFDIVNYKEISRKNHYIDSSNCKKWVSSTLVREAIKTNNKELLEKLVDKEIYNNIV